MDIRVAKKKRATVIIENEDGTESKFDIRKPTVGEQETFSIAFEKADKEGQTVLTREYICGLGIDSDVMKALDVSQAEAIYEGITGFMKKK